MTDAQADRQDAVDPLVVAKNVIADKSTGYADPITKNILAQAVLNMRKHIDELGQENLRLRGENVTLQERKESATTELMIWRGHADARAARIAALRTALEFAKQSILGGWRWSREHDEKINAVLSALPADRPQQTGFYEDLLRCPECINVHRDIGIWSKRLHHTHRCAYCKHEWREEDYIFGTTDGMTSKEQRIHKEANADTVTPIVEAARVLCEEYERSETETRMGDISHRSMRRLQQVVAAHDQAQKGGDADARTGQAQTTPNDNTKPPIEGAK